MSKMSIGAKNQLADTLEKAGFTSEEITRLKQSDNLKGIRAILNGQAEIFFPIKKYREENGVIYFKVTSDGTTGEQWIIRLEKAGFKISKQTRDLLLSKDFKTTTGVTYEIAVIKGNIFTDSNHITQKIRNEAAKRKLVTPNPEAVCLIREMFSDEEIKAVGLQWMVTFHRPTKDSGGKLFPLDTGRDCDGSWPNTDFDISDRSWCNTDGFAFVVSQVFI